MGVEGVEGLKGRIENDGNGTVAAGQEEVSGWGGVVESYLVRLESLLDGRFRYGGWESGNWDKEIVLVEGLSAVFQTKPMGLCWVSIPSSQP